jgi:DNA-binding NarL/FixJ family response regulator
MRRMDGITATRLIKAQFPQIAVIGLSVERKDYLVYAMQKAGAFEVITRDNAVLDLYSAIQRAVAAVQPVLIMEEAPDSERAIEASNPATTAELMSETNKRPDREDPDNYS